MLLTLSTTHQPATDLGYLLHKHPDRVQTFRQSFGNAVVYYPHVANDRCEACLLLDVDEVALVRGKGRSATKFLSDNQYVNDRPYVASSLMSVAIADVYRTALNGACKDRPELVETSLPLKARIDVLPMRGPEKFLNEVFEPLGYTVEAERKPLDPQFTEWGDSPYFSVTLTGTKTLVDLLKHLYVLIPVFDGRKHYFISDDELDKLLTKGEHWLAAHPAKETITRRYFNNKPSLYRQALARLVEEEQLDIDEAQPSRAEESLERKLSLNEQRLGTVLSALRSSGARSVVDLGCGEGKLLKELIEDRQFHRVVGVDVAVRSLEIASRRLKAHRLPLWMAEKLELLHGSLIYRDKRLENFDAAAVVEVIEHLDPPRLKAFERVLFEFARPKTVVLTTPNREYNVMWETLPEGRLRHPDHRFEWTRAEFQEWADGVAERFGYQVRFAPVGPVDEIVGSPTQMGVFTHDK
ncbi:3' terminal RNA ribose 2'-O-methyltransferase Hen1 [Stratiformator vulcanicus]|uniref:Small RNA 2'-O-methyltransferase n=1 Tax=Stratiformator vulcanicus TaxID=2527980 RepID=A0A517R4A5_9PLAN|nr:hypothetical protein Pan189_31220 [Stratiformator vulcanicus]